MSLPKNIEAPPSIFQSQTIKNSGNIIIQNWNTRKNIPKEIEEYVTLNLPIIADKGKLNQNTKVNVKQLPPIDKNYYAKQQ